MAESHDFEFQLGRNRALRGRGWRGLLALGLLLTACVITATGILRVVSPMRIAVESLIGKITATVHLI
jgi:hypothetical protein